MPSILDGTSGAARAALGRGAVKPLRPVPKTEAAGVADLKSGGAAGGLLGRLTRRAQGRDADLSLPERLEKLAKIKKSATEYEAVFVDQLVKQMRPSPLAKTPGGDTFSEIAEQPFRDFLSQAGGLGLARSMVERIARQEGLERTLQEHPEIMGPNWRPVIPRSLGPKLPGALKIGAPAATEEGPKAGLQGAPGAPDAAKSA